MAWITIQHWHSAEVTHLLGLLANFKHISTHTLRMEITLELKNWSLILTDFMDDQLMFELMNAAQTLPIYGIILSGHLHWHIHYGHWTLSDNFHILGFVNEAGVRRYWCSH